MDLQKEVAFFDQFEAEHGDYDVLSERAYDRLLREFQRWVKPSPGESCVDLGCGTGAFTRRLARFELNRSGVDISPRSINRARQRDPEAHYLTADIRETGLPEEHFDIVTYSGVLHHCDSVQTRLIMLREGFRLLRPGGRLFSFDPSAHSPSMFLYRDPRSPFFSRRGKTENEVLLQREELRDLLQKAGFQNIAVQGVGGTTFRYVESPIARKLLPLYNLYEVALRSSPWENRFGTFLAAFGTKMDHDAERDDSATPGPDSRR